MFCPSKNEPLVDLVKKLEKPTSDDAAMVKVFELETFWDFF